MSIPEKRSLATLVDRLCLAVLLAGVCALGGCGSAVSSGSNTALSSIDLVRMTDDMAAQISSASQVNAAIQQEGRLRIVVEPVENNLTGEILTRGEGEAFTSRVRALLSQHEPAKFAWIMNRDAYNDLRGRELGYDLGPSPEAMNPEYALTAKFSSLTQEDADRRSEYYLCVYELTNLQTRAVLWSGKYEVKKNVAKGFLD
jgi:hypothetical protein